MSSTTWRNLLHTFVDESQQIYTAINIPPIINIAKFEDAADLHMNLNLGSLLRPRISVGRYPELPFVLLRPPVGDPLLSRLSMDPDSLAPTQFEGGWALPDDIRNAWIRLEKGLLHVSELLLTSTERSSCGTSARYAIRYQEHWPPPEDWGYRDLHRSALDAKASICRTHMVFRLLTARCSLAVALWLFPGPVQGLIPQVTATEHDDATDSTVPEWVKFLGDEGVHASWIDAIRDSIITDFSINLRVGTVIDPSKCKWLAMLPVLRAANVPVFVMWRDPTEIVACFTSLPFMKLFTPRSRLEVHLALQHPPAGRPRIVTLCCDGETRPLPNYSASDDSTPPFGPYQLPGESRSEFFKRRERYRPDQERRETQVQAQWRRERMAHALAGFPPSLRSRVYLWIHAQLIHADLLPRWHGYEYRHPIPPSAYRSLWMVHPADCRRYNSFYDEWDLWFPPGWGDSREESPEAHRMELQSILDASRRALRAPLTEATKEAAKRASERMVAATVHDEQELLNPSPEDRQIQDVGMPASDHLHSWYGLLVDDTRSFSDVDYEAWIRRTRLLHVFSEMKDKFTDDEATIKCIAGWTWAMLTRNFKSRALASTWDLDPRHPRYLLRDSVPDPRILISLEHRQAATRNIDSDDIGRWVLVGFQRDPDTQTWSLLTSAMGALFLVRHIEEADTSCDALFILATAGIPARTGIFLDRPPSPVLSMSTPLIRRLRAPWRQREDRPGLKEYDAYCQRVLELSHRPHVRAAWLKGGIVWRIMMEVTGRYVRSDTSLTIKDELVKGPSGSTDHYQSVTKEQEGGAYYDDELSIDELDVIAGVVKVYTGIGAQTEDVSWWPKHAIWVKGGWYTGIWTSWDEHWFQRRLKAIYAKAGPLNAGEWRVELRKHKKASELASIVDQRSWEFTYKHFVQNPTPVQH